MAWQIPQSQTIAGIVADLGTTDDVFVASGVTIASTASLTIFGTGSSHEVLIYGTVANPVTNPILLGDNVASDSGETVTIKPGGQVHAFELGSVAIVFFAMNSHVTNQGLIAAPDGSGIVLGGESATTASTIVNSGTIDAGLNAIARNIASTETLVLQNSGLISGGDAAYAPFGGGNPNARDLITNTGQMIGDILLAAGNDVYNGAQGRLSGDVFGGAGNDVITGGIDHDTFFGDDGNDTLTGGLGRDRLTGGADRDFFDFNSVKESVKGANRDMILDFNRADDDRIDLRTIDAKTGVGGNQNFKFIGKSKFNDEKGELRYIDKGSTVIVQGDVNGDGKADFEIFVAVGALAKGDFIL
ncbi:MAG: calcium-binding protein [Methyloceanibacter sp.]|uniref:calcium-binding protein n=1 Tax=Methyloceanibacter sp. TaxID=1965321 RepID=UPI003D6CBC84